MDADISLLPEHVGYDPRFHDMAVAVPEGARSALVADVNGKPRRVTGRTHAALCAALRRCGYTVAEVVDP